MKKLGFIILFFVVLGIVFSAIIIVRMIMNNQNQNGIEMKTLYIKALDNNTDIETDFIVVINDTIQAQGRTVTGGYEELIVPSLPLNTYVLNYGGGYYVNRYVYMNSPLILTPYRIGKIIAENVTVKDKVLNISVRAVGGQFRQLGFCVRWSSSILEVKNFDYPVGLLLDTKDMCEEYKFIWNSTTYNCSVGFINIFPQRLANKYDKCYYTRTTLDTNQSMSIELEYSAIKELSEYDDIKILFFDSDRNYLNQYIVEDGNGNDVGGLDYSFVVPSVCSNSTCKFEGIVEECDSTACIL